MSEQETCLNYFLHYLAPSIVSAIVVFVCFWLGGRREKSKEKKKQEDETKKQKETVVLSLWDIFHYAAVNKSSIGNAKIEKTKEGININTAFLQCFPKDFYEVAKAYNFFDFDYALKENFRHLRMSVEDVNKLISIYNDFSLKHSGGNGASLKRFENVKEQITKSCDNILDIFFSKIIGSKYLFVPRMLNHYEGMIKKYGDEEMIKKLEEIKKGKQQG